MQFGIATPSIKPETVLGSKLVSLWAAGGLLLALALAGLGLLALLASSAVAGGGVAPLLSLLAPPEVVLLSLVKKLATVL